MNQLFQDLRFAARLLFKDKAFTTTAVLTLALTIGANAAVFCIVNAVLLRPLAFEDADRLVVVYNSYPKAGAVRAGSGVPDYYDRQRETTAFEQLAMYRQGGQTIGGRGSEAERVSGMQATTTLFPLLRVKAIRGRTFNSEDGEPGNERKVVLSYGLWQRLFAGKDSAVGSELRLNGRPHTIVGVLPPDFRFTTPGIDLWVPVAFKPEDRSDDNRHSNSWVMLGRLKRDASIRLAQEQIDALNARNLERFPQFKQILVDVGFNTKVQPLQASIVESFSRTLYLLWGGAAFVLLIGAVNVTSLVLARSSVRMKEMATRHALGAGFARLVRQTLTETTLVAAAGGALGLLVAYGVLRLLDRLGLEQLPRASEVSLDVAVVVYTMLITLAVGALVGLIPSARFGGRHLVQAFREEGRTGSASRSARLVRRALVAVEVAFALVLLVGAALLFASFRHVTAIDPGFVSAGVLTGSLNLPPARYAGDAELRAYARRAMDRVKVLPGVTKAGWTNSLPFGDNFNDSVMLPDGYEPRPGDALISPARSSISAGYMETMGIRLLSGRRFTEADNESSPLVVIVDDRLAKRFWPGENPIGKRLVQPDSADDVVHPSAKAPRHTVVGVVSSVKMQGLVGGDERLGAVYFPYAQMPTRTLYLAVHASADPGLVLPAVRRELAAVDPEVPFFRVKALAVRVDESLVTRRAPMVLAMAFGGVALFLAAVGIYGMLAYQVAQRRREIGIRMALGENAAGIFRLVLAEGMTLVAVGAGLGLAGALAVGRVLQSQLYDVRATDPRLLMTASAVLVMVAVAACVLPARRASRVSPVVALTDQ
ncbi:MAG: ABC transporter permease [Acidobacteria bacterium]|nr:MAG: ABC transporter permease [Acidobacteriota bacterium]